MKIRAIFTMMPRCFLQWTLSILQVDDVAHEVVNEVISPEVASSGLDLKKSLMGNKHAYACIR